MRGVRPGYDPLVDDLPRLSTQGWQHFASEAVEASFLADTIWPRLDVPHQALMRSQQGPMAGIPFTCMPLSSESRFQPQEFRVLLLRRLWQPLPLSSSICRCGRPLDSRGHHRAACSVAGVLGRRGFALESAAARVCREAGDACALSDPAPPWKDSSLEQGRRRSARHQFPDQECEGCEAGRHRVERRCVLAFGTTGSEDSGGACWAAGVRATSLKSVEHETLFERIPQVGHTQAAWLLLLMCASPRATFWLRSVNPDLTDVFAEHHDAHVWHRKFRQS